MTMIANVRKGWKADIRTGAGSLNFFSSRSRPFAALIRDDLSEGMDVRCVCAVKRRCCGSGTH